MPQILIVDDNAVDREFLTALVHKYFDCTCLHAVSGEEALNHIKNDRDNQIAAALLDLSMPHMDGRTALPKLLELRPQLQVIAITGNKSVASVVDIIKLGAAAYLIKPVDPDLFANAVSKALHMYELRKELEAMQNRDKNHTQFSSLIGSSLALQTCIKFGKRAAGSDISVLITGESGTGKEMIARAIHEDGTRSGKPFVAINCGALPKDLVESALFGHKKRELLRVRLQMQVGSFLKLMEERFFLTRLANCPSKLRSSFCAHFSKKKLNP